MPKNGIKWLKMYVLSYLILFNLYINLMLFLIVLPISVISTENIKVYLDTPFDHDFRELITYHTTTTDFTIPTWVYTITQAAELSYMKQHAGTKVVFDPTALYNTATTYAAGLSSGTCKANINENYPIDCIETIIKSYIFEDTTANSAIKVKITTFNKYDTMPTMVNDAITRMHNADNGEIIISKMLYYYTGDEFNDIGNHDNDNTQSYYRNVADINITHETISDNDILSHLYIAADRLLFAGEPIPYTTIVTNTYALITGMYTETGEASDEEMIFTEFIHPYADSTEFQKHVSSVPVYENGATDKIVAYGHMYQRVLSNFKAVNDICIILGYNNGNICFDDSFDDYIDPTNALSVDPDDNHDEKYCFIIGYNRRMWTNTYGVKVSDYVPPTPTPTSENQNNNTPATTTSPESKKSNVALIASLSSIGGALLIAGGVILGIFCHKRKVKAGNEDQQA